MTALTVHPHQRVLQAPETLGLLTREAFRQQANELLDAMSEGRGRLEVDMSATREIDSSGLSALVMIQRHAVDRRQSVILTHRKPEIDFLLVLTKLDELFVPSASA